MNNTNPSKKNETSLLWVKHYYLLCRFKIVCIGNLTICINQGFSDGLIYFIYWTDRDLEIRNLQFLLICGFYLSYDYINCLILDLEMFLFYNNLLCMTRSFKIPKGQSESVNQIRTAKRKRTNNDLQNITHKTKDRGP